MTINERFIAVMGFYAYLTFVLMPAQLGPQSGPIAGAAVSYALWHTVGKSFVY